MTQRLERSEVHIGMVLMKLNPDAAMVARDGAMAVVTNIDDLFVYVRWLDNKAQLGTARQSDGAYLLHDFVRFIDTKNPNEVEAWLNATDQS